MGVYLTDVHLMSTHLMGMHLTGVYLTDVYLMNVYLMACTSFMSLPCASGTGGENPYIDTQDG